MSADEPALQQRDRPMAALHGVFLAPLDSNLEDRLVALIASFPACPCACACASGAIWPSENRFTVFLSLFSAVRRTLPLASAATRTTPRQAHLFPQRAPRRSTRKGRAARWVS